MPTGLVYAHNFARVTAVASERVELAYDLDHARWPWLALAPHHPVLVEKYQYFSAVTASEAVGRDVEPTFSALTRFRWECTADAWRGHLATRGVCEPWADARGLGYALTVGDDDGCAFYRMSGEGFVFDDRDFRAWREKTRRAAREGAGDVRLDLAPAPTVGLGAGGRSFVTLPCELDGRIEVTALVPTDGGFHPAHPFHTGSGDHVNAGHLFDCVLQAAHVVLGAERLDCTGGEARFTRFVELDVPFAISLAGRHAADDGRTTLEFAVAQAGRDNATVSMTLAARELEAI